jgi:hypothetical protein
MLEPVSLRVLPEMRRRDGAVSSFPVIHTLSGAFSYKIEYGGNTVALVWRTWSAYDCQR